jgi:cysteinyl-tRNA synthetase
MQDGYAYEANGSVYFDVLKYNEDYSKKNQPYGILSGRNLEDQLDTTRELDNQDEKKNKVDFALWKKAPVEHIMRWQSPWGEGFPGWHIECSAMATKYLGKKFDIHGGGMDLQFPHHECEIAQSTVCNHEIPARYWMHNNMITINGRKMGKSYNNVIKLSELFSGNHHELTQAYTPMTVRFFILQSQYRGTLDFSNEALQASEKALRRLMEAYEWLKAQSFVAGTTAKDDNLDAQVNTWLKELTEFMEDDFNTAKVVANLFEIIPTINSLKDKHITIDALSGATWIFAQEQLTLFIENILGLKVDTGANRQQLNSVIQLLIEIRKDAKARKDFATSDKIRNQLTDMGIQLKDEKDGEMSYTFA